MPKIVRFFITADIRPLEIFLSMCMIVWGLWLLAPWNSFMGSPSYAILNQMAGGEPKSELIWGVLSVSAATMKLISIKFNFKILETVSLMLKTFLWLCISTSIFVATPTTLGVPIYGFFALTNLFILIFCGEK